MGYCSNPVGIRGRADDWCYAVMTLEGGPALALFSFHLSNCSGTDGSFQERGGGQQVPVAAEVELDRELEA